MRVAKAAEYECNVEKSIKDFTFRELFMYVIFFRSVLRIHISTKYLNIAIGRSISFLAVEKKNNLSVHKCVATLCGAIR